jgi:peroxisomal membrane protein 2
MPRPFSRLSPEPRSTSRYLSFVVIELQLSAAPLQAMKMFIYGFLVSAPLGHLLLNAQQRVFAGRTSGKAKLAQILSSNLIISPISVAGE